MAVKLGMPPDKGFPRIRCRSVRCVGVLVSLAVVLQLPVSFVPSAMLRSTKLPLRTASGISPAEPSELASSRCGGLVSGSAFAVTALALASRRWKSRGGLARRAWPWEDDDPYAKCSALKIQIGMQFSKNILATLNKLADTADTSSDEGLHKLLLDVVLALKRSETTWRYAECEQLLFDAEDEGRAAGGKLQRWGLEAQEKWGDGDWEKDKGGIGVTEYVVVTLMLSCYGAVLGDEKDAKIRSVGDVKKILGAVSEVQADELLQLDVQWIPEEEGDSLSAMEVTMKFPELVMI
mmetsp:Transcript_16971/g.39994  ORF Transcript_16971/g.39994 Transcript_16971/m.39994 type:complete len:293 (+) Transcript_16971:25-903(+)|eukprot:s1828_g4.t1